MPDFTLLSHNVFWFQGVPNPTKTAGEPFPEIVATLAGLYRAANVTLLCLQEVQSARALHLLVDALELEGRYCPGALQPEFGGAALWRPGNRVAVSDSQHAALRPQRMWQKLTLISGGWPALQVCNLHLPSDRRLGASVAGEKRCQELAHILTDDPAPAILVGDFNEPPDGCAAQFLRQQEYHDVAALVGKGGLPTTLEGERKDQIWVHGALKDKVRDYGVIAQESLAINIEATPSLSGKEYLSDHLPIWARFEL